jgi:hypothetical protein
MGRRKVSEIDRQDREEFVIARLKRGLSPLEVQRQFSKVYGLGPDSARNWVRGAADRLGELESPDSRRRSKQIIVEMYHDQIVAYQSEILAITQEIRKVEANPEVGLTTVVEMIELKSRVRDRMVKVMIELARIKGVASPPKGDWRAALNTLLNNGLIPIPLSEKSC